jgi:peptidoglycan hydrolase CwlO-like protein
MDNINVALTLGCTVLGAYMGYMTYKNAYRKDIQTETVQQTKIEVQLTYISQGIIDIQAKLNNQDKFNTDIAVRLATVENTIKSAHHRIDEITTTKGEM